MNCSIDNFRDNVTKQMLQYGFAVAASKYSSNPTLQNAIRNGISTNQIPKKISIGNKSYRGFDIAKKVADAINQGWKSMVANVATVNDTHSININISPDMMKLLEAADFTAEERSAFNDIAPGYANSLEEEAILKYESMKSSDIDKLVSAQANNFLSSVLSTLKRAFPTVNYQIVSDTDAREITKNSANPYTGQGVSFFYNGTVYIIEGNVTPKTLIHEFLHPLVKSIEVENPGLFDNLVNESKTVDNTYGLGVGKRLQEEIDEDPETFSFDNNAYKREYVTRVLERIASERLLENREDGILYNFFNKVFYALKQIFRKVFGSKINVSKLSAYTSLSDLADMLKMSEFNLNAELFTTEDYVEYLSKVEEEINKTAELLADSVKYNKEAAKDPRNIKFGLSNLDDLIKQLETLVDNNTEYFKNNNMIDPELNAIIFNSETGNLEKIKEELRLNKKFLVQEQLDLSEDIRNALNAEKNDAQKAYRLISSIFEIQALIYNLAGPDKTVLIDKTSTDDFKQNLVLIEKLEGMLRSFQTLAQSVNSIIVKLDRNNQLAQSLNQTIEYSENGLNQLKKQRFNNIKEVINVPLSAINDTIQSLYNDLIEKIDEEIATKGSNSLLEKRKEYYIKTRDSLMVSEKRLEDLLQGKAGDSDFLEGYILSAVQSSDPIYGTLGSIVKNAYNNIEANMVNVYSSYFKDLNELQNKAGITKFNYSSKYRQIITEATRLVRTVEEGESNKEVTLEEKSDYFEFLHSTLVSQATNDIRRLEAEKEDASRNNDLITVAEKSREISELKDKYFFGSVLEGHNIRKQMLSTEWGVRMFIKRLKIEDNIRVLELVIKAELALNNPEARQNIIDKQEQIKEQYILLNEITSIYKKNGEAKTGQEYQDAIDYKNFYTVTESNLEIEREETIQKFVEAYKLNEELLGANTPEFGQWLAENTYIKRKDEYFSLVQQIFDNIGETNNKSTSFTAKLKDLNNERSALGKQLSQLRILYSDPRTKMMLIDQMTPEAVKKVNDIEQRLFEIGIEIDVERGLPKNIKRKDIELLHTVRKLYAGDYEYESTDPPVIKSLKQNNFRLYEKYIAISEALKEFRSEQPSNVEQEYINGEWGKFYDIQYKGKTVAYEMYKKEAIQNINNGIYVDIAFINTDTNFIKALENKDFRKFIEDHHTKFEIEEEGTVSFAYVPNGIHIEQKINDNYKDMVEFRNSKGELVKTNFPSRNYHALRTKEAVKTPRIMGVTVNAFGEWLPKPIEVLYAESKGNKITTEFLENIPDMSDSEYNSFINDNEELTKYVNKEYYNLKKTDKDLWNLLEYLKKMSFTQQKETSKMGRLNFQVPSFFASNFEVAQKTLSGQKRSGLSVFLSSIKAKLFGKEGDEAEEGYSNVLSAETEEEKRTRLKLISLDFFGDELSKIPVAGKYPIDLDKVSMDIPLSMFRYFYSIEEVKEKVKIMPIARGIEKVLADEENALKEMDKINKYAFLQNNLTIFAGAKSKKEASIRKQMVESFNRTIFEGENVRGFLSDATPILKILNNVTRFTSTVFLSTPESAIRNRVQMGMQNIINLAAQDGVDRESYTKGEIWATKYMFGQTTHAYQGGTYTFEQMMVDAWDPKQGSSKKRIGRSFNRSYAQDAADWQSFVLAPRTWLETQGAIKLWAQRMFYEKVEITENGVTTKIPYMEAWYIVDGKLTLRPGIDKTYDVEGVKFNLIKNRIHQQIALTNGDSSALGKSYGDKFVIYNQLLSMKRFFYMMFLNRFGTNFKYDKEKSFFDAWSFSPRLNYSTGETQEGYYITSLRFIANYFRNIFTKNPNFNIYWSMLTPYEKRNLIKTFSDIMLSLVLWLIGRMLFEYDPDDEDRYKKLRANSAPLPIFGTADEGQFHLEGYAFNKALQLILGFQEEHNTFMPLPGMGLKTYTNLFQIKMATFQPSADLIKNVITYGMLGAAGDERGFYDKRVGPYEWQQKDSAKIVNFMLKYIGLSGTSTDPVLGIQQRESFAR